MLWWIVVVGWLLVGLALNLFIIFKDGYFMASDVPAAFFCLVAWPILIIAVLIDRALHSYHHIFIWRSKGSKHGS